MKTHLKYSFLLLLIVSLFNACKKDNYAPPNASIYGKILDANTGEVVPGATSTRGQYGRLSLYQQDYGSSNPNPITCDLHADGSYENGNIFSGKYKVVLTSGPWDYLDTVIADVNGRTEKDLKVHPWLTVSLQVGTITSTSISVSYTIKNNFPGTSKIARVAAMIDVNKNVNVNDYATNGRALNNVEGVDDSNVESTTYTKTFDGLKPGTTYYIVAGGRRPSPTYYNYSQVAVVKTNN